MIKFFRFICGLVIGLATVCFADNFPEEKKVYLIKKIDSVTVEVSVEEFKEEEINQAIRAGLEFIFKDRLSDYTILHEPLMKEALNAAEKYLVQYRYLKGENKVLRIKYQKQLLEQLLEKVTDKIWIKKRIDLLCWFVHPAYLDEVVNENNLRYEEMIGKIKKSAQERGIKLIFPLWDLQDQEQVQGNDVLRLDFMRISKASQRYGVSSVIFGFLNDKFEGKVIVWNGAERRVLTVKKDLELLWDLVLDAVSNREIAVNNEESAIFLTVQGVKDLEQCKFLEQYFFKLSPLVKRILIKQIEKDDAIVFEIKVVGGGESLRAILNNQSYLKLIDEENLIYGI